jgi:hypothetical protein
MLLTELLQLSEPGTVPGLCYVCGQETETGWKEAPSAVFTAWAAVYAGEVMCERCRPLVKRGEFRHRSWVATSEGVRFTASGDRSFLWEALLHPPSPPFAIYLTRAGQKQGALGLIHYVSDSCRQFWVGTDWVDRPVLLEESWVRDQGHLVARLRERKVPKGVLVDGGFSPAHYKHAMEEGWLEDLELARSLAGDPRWEVIVYAYADGP